MGPPALGHTLGLVLMHGQRLVVAHDSSADMRLDISIVLESLLQNLDGLVPHVPGAFRPVEILSGNVIIAICECYHVFTRQLVRLVGDACLVIDFMLQLRNTSTEKIFGVCTGTRGASTTGSADVPAPGCARAAATA